MSVREFVEQITIMGFHTDEFNRGSVGEEERAHSTPELGVDKFLSGANLVKFGCGEKVRVRVNTIP